MTSQLGPYTAGPSSPPLPRSEEEASPGPSGRFCHRTSFGDALLRTSFEGRPLGVPPRKTGGTPVLAAAPLNWSSFGAEDNSFPGHVIDAEKQQNALIEGHSALIL